MRNHVKSAGIVTMLIIGLAWPVTAADPTPGDKCGAPATTAPPSAAPPAQPAKGPGGAEYAHQDVVISEHLDGGKKYHLFQPANPRPAKAPVIILTHGWAAIHPVAYGKWIEHLVRRGNIVIYPHYQANLFTLSHEFLPNTIASVKDALNVLQKEESVLPDLSRVAFVGHSAGGLLAANLAAVAKDEGLPVPKALMVVQPGVSQLFPMKDMKQIPAGTLLLAIVGDQDKVTGDADAKRIFAETTQVSSEDKDFIILRSDDHGRPRLRGSHMAPVALGGKGIDTKGAARHQIRAALERGLDGGTGNNKGGLGNGEDGDTKTTDSTKPTKTGPQRVGGEGNTMTDAMDYYGTWKLFDGLTDAAFHKKNRKYALGNTPEQRFMGKWSDGTAVKELVVTKEP